LNENQGSRRVDWRDAVGLFGIALITGGSAMIYLPAGLMVCGALLLLGAVLSARRG
jgi:hypothetical protein